MKCLYDGCRFETDDEEVMEWHITQMDMRGLHEAQISDNPKPFCLGCIRTPEEIYEYLPQSTDSKLSPDEYVKSEEGTYNRENGHFLCTVCYINAGSPSSPSGWKAP